MDAVELPAVGSRLTQGDKGWSFMVDSVEIPMLSPVDGEVVAVNQEVLRNPTQGGRRWKATAGSF